MLANFLHVLPPKTSISFKLWSQNGDLAPFELQPTPPSGTGRKMPGAWLPLKQLPEVFLYVVAAKLSRSAFQLLEDQKCLAASGKGFKGRQAPGIFLLVPGGRVG